MPNEFTSEWIPDPDGDKGEGSDRYIVDIKICSECGSANPFTLLGRPLYSKYCPNCGRYMINYDRC